MLDKKYYAMAVLLIGLGLATIAAFQVNLFGAPTEDKAMFVMTGIIGPWAIYLGLSLGKELELNVAYNIVSLIAGVVITALFLWILVNPGEMHRLL